MTILLFSNDATTTLAAPILSTDTHATLAAGSGILFPSPQAGQGFKLTLSLATLEETSPIFEIVLVTSLIGDAIIMTRAQEGTTALAWAAGASAGNYYTAGTAQTFVQIAPGTPGYFPAPTTAGTVLGWDGSEFVWVTASAPTINGIYGGDAFTSSNDTYFGGNAATVPANGIFGGNA